MLTFCQSECEGLTLGDEQTLLQGYCVCSLSKNSDSLTFLIITVFGVQMVLLTTSSPGRFSLA